jgi:hypothetical protein
MFNHLEDYRVHRTIGDGIGDGQFGIGTRLLRWVVSAASRFGCLPAFEIKTATAVNQARERVAFGPVIPWASESQTPNRSLCR